jgi:hypothetical protein
MYQIYFLSIVVNLVVGIVLSREIISGKLPALANLIGDIEETNLFRLAGGIAAVAVGILKLLWVTSGDVLILGDLFPALSGIAMGATLLFEHFKEKSSDGLPVWAARTADFLIDHKQVWGIAGVVSAVLHFFFYPALFL